MRGRIFALLALGTMAWFASMTKAASVTLYLTTVNATLTGGTWQLYIADSQDNDGLANFDVDVVGSDGIVVNSAATFKGPRPVDPSNQYADGQGGSMGFNTSVFSGSNSGTGRVGITAGQDTVYSANDDPTYDMGVLVGVGQEAPLQSPQNGSQGPIDGSGSPTGLIANSNSPWSYVTPGTLFQGGASGPNGIFQYFVIGGTLVEQGTYTGGSGGYLSANVDGYVEVLGTSDNGDNEAWGLPPYQQGNTPVASIVPNSSFGPPNPKGDTISFDPEPASLALAVVSMGLAAMRRSRRHADRK